MGDENSSTSPFKRALNVFFSAGKLKKIPRVRQEKRAVKNSFFAKVRLSSELWKSHYSCKVDCRFFIYLLLIVVLDK